MDWFSLLRLVDWMEVRGLLSATRYVSVAEQLAIFLFMVGHNNSNRAAQERFQHSGETISRLVSYFLKPSMIRNIKI